MLSRGQKINDRYEISKSIGEGGMANVYLAHDTILDRDVAIKVLRGDLENEEKFIRRFQREAKSVSDLSHPNIVEVFDVGEEEGQHYIVMEYIDGKTLKQLVTKRGALTVAEVIDIMSQITDGLACAHDAYIIHRDIKPQNILILDDGMIKITDFGIATSMNATQLTQTNSVMGSVHYLPPEQAEGKSATIKSDIYSSGILMYELLTGSVPFKGDNAVEIALKQMKDRIPSVRKQNPLIPQSVENIILKATAKNPKNRYESIRDMHEDLIHALDEEKVNEVKYHYPYPESELDERKAIPIKKDSGMVVDEVDIDNSSNKENYVSKKKKNTNKKIGIILGSMVVVTIVLMVIVLVILNSKNSNSSVVVPDVSNMSLEKAEAMLTKKGFKYDVDEESSDSVKEGLVIKTKPSKGVSKKKGSIIVIVTSTGSTSLILKDYVGSDSENIKSKLEKLDVRVKIEKKKVESPKDYLGKQNIVIAQNPEYSEGQEVKLDGEIVLYIPDILDSYPNLKEDGYTLGEAEEFASDYGLTMIVKDKKGNVINDYSNYLDSLVTSQNRNGKIATGVSFTVTIDVDMSKYNLVINYLDKEGNSIKESITESHKDGETGSIVCPGILGYKYDNSSVNYKINGADTSVSCTYVKNSNSVDDDSSEDNN